MVMFRELAVDTPAWWVVTAAFVQGIAISFLFLPVTNLAYATLPSYLRTDGGATAALGRNIGSSVGLSWIFAQVLDTAQRNRAYMAEQLNLYDTQHWQGIGPALEAAGGVARDGSVDPGTLTAVIGPEMARQAAVIGYDNAFSMMVLVVALALPLVLLMKIPKAN